MSNSEMVTVTCPQCQTQYSVRVTAIINVTQDPTLKGRFLQRQLNISQCPQCKFTGPLNIPILYYDGEKELALTFIPNRMNLAHADEQKIIGDLTNKLMDSLPPEERKAYLLNPKAHLTMEALTKDIYLADGVTEEMLESQAKKMNLLDKLLAAEDEAKLKALIKENDAELDYQFFEIVTAMAIRGMQEHSQQQGQQLLAFRQYVAELSTEGKTHIAAIDKKIGLEPLTPEKLLKSLKEASSDDEFIAIINSGRNLLDYSFFQNLTSEIDAAQANNNNQEAEKLKALRSRILDVSAKLEEKERKMMKEASNLLQKLLESSNPKQILNENIDQVNDSLLAILAANIQQTQQEGKEEITKKLATLYELIAETIQENLPPDMALLNKLLEASPQNRQFILEQHKDQLSNGFINFLNDLQNTLTTQGQHRLVDEINAIKNQIETI